MGTHCFLRLYRLIIIQPISILNYVRVRSITHLAHKIHGKHPSERGDPVVILHGLLGSKKNWESMSKRIASATNRAVIAVDARNHGESPHSNSHTYPDLASDVFQLLDKLSIPKAVLIGHSMGGRTAMVLALTQPEKISSLIVVDISPVSTAGILNDFFPRLLEVMKSITFEGLQNQAKARALAKDKLQASGIVDDIATLSFILMNVGMKPDKTIGWLCNINALKENFKYIATFPAEISDKQYKGPTLFIGGDQSNYIPPSDITPIQKIFPEAQLKYVPGVGHNVHAEDPSTFFNLVTQFLATK